ncbi:dehydrogenase E1 component subunit alpha/beta [Pontibacter sp. G13]|uniref:alpha-ketoacid dehydrogenase subunit alpha/beta n=1 Tax=Pontibacter sp. G13 TaxID=3074898 RepID=UPI00288BBDCE|nr:dehydrogenase E1 component subunit alpha/beta [Pontibacter sp. G13]WNJ21519.1 dehydrogenase E1 component subunit alpha/beta [Pontibacter sp. G13]
MDFDRKKHSDEFLLARYRDLLFPRMVEEKMLILLRQGRISKWFSGIGQEAIAVGLTSALQDSDYLLPLHRNLGVFTTRKLPLVRLIAQWLGKEVGYTQGRDRSFHFGSPEDRVIGMISHLGAMLPVADGLALASNLDGEDFIAVPFSGDGGASEGDFHEALNVASVWDLPVLFVLENNGYGLSTPSEEQFRAKRLADRAKGYGIRGVTIDGNNILEVIDQVERITKRMRKDRKPVLLECLTFRMRGHEEASGTKYVPKELFEEWGKKDPVSNYEQYLLQEGVLTQDVVDAIRAEFKAEINEAVEQAFALPDIQPDPARETAQIYAPLSAQPILPNGQERNEMRFVDAIQDGLRESMCIHPELVLMGQDIAEYGGVFKITEGFVEEFGKDRVRNTPICESAIVGAALGLSLAGKKAMMEMQFSDFVSCGFNQIVNNLAKNHYRWGHAPDVVIRMPSGGGMGAGPFHSQSTESWFTHTPGLKVVYPSTPEDAKGLLTAALADPNPVMYFEHKGLYRSETGTVPTGYYQTPIGKARTVRSGEDMTIITYGLGVRWATEAIESLDADVEIIDLRTLIPWDREAVFTSVRKTGKALVLYEDTQTGAFGAEVAASISEACFESLDGPVMRLGSLDTPVPFHPELEKRFLANDRLKDRLEELLAY